MGKIEQPAIRLVSEWPSAVADGAWQVLCPFLADVVPAAAFWIGGLAWHDANASLLAAIREPAPAGTNVFAGVFCTDPFRRDIDIFAALRQAGIAGVVNLPTVSFFDGELGAILDSFNLGIGREIDFLERARDAGFRIAGCVSTTGPIDRMLQVGAELIIAHAGVPPPGRDDPAEVSAARWHRRFAAHGPPVITASTLLETLTGSGAPSPSITSPGGSGAR
jgi:hypothetical protein